jgi:hypothetical protein
MPCRLGKCLYVSAVGAEKTLRIRVLIRHRGWLRVKVMQPRLPSRAWMRRPGFLCPAQMD